MNGSCFDLDRVLDILTVINPARFSKSYGNNNQLVSKTYSPTPSNRSAGSTMEARILHLHILSKVHFWSVYLQLRLSKKL